MEIFDDEAAQESFDDFVISLPKLVRKTLAVGLTFYFEKRQKKNKRAAALEAAYITGFNEKPFALIKTTTSKIRVVLVSLVMVSINV